MSDTPLRMPEIRTIGLAEPFAWLRAGWRDFLAIPASALLYGAGLSAISALIFWALWRTGSAELFFVLLGGFLLIGPLLAMGLYEAARRLETGARVTFLDMIWVRPAIRREFILLGLLLVFLYLLWTRMAHVIYAVSTSRILRTPEQFLDFALTTTEGQLMVLVTLLTGAGVAFVNFSLAVIAAPMLLDTRYHVFLALAASVKAVNRNFFPMLLWAVIITLLTLIGIAAAFAGLAVVFPVIGFASWHAYRGLTAPRNAPAP